ncbi:MAG: InlB B-repeat-containing protein [Clostridia bacterium]|nr:InlB B-repeat-containing protein [Clostridia bacterium]
MKKKILLVCLSLFAAISLVACGTNPADQSGSSESKTQSSVESSENVVSSEEIASSEEITSSEEGTQPETHNYVEHDAVDATCQAEGNAKYYTCEDCDKIFDEDYQEIEAIPVTQKAEHVYVLQEEIAGTCNEKGTLAHYTCENCPTLFDLTKVEIESAEGDYDATNHSADEQLVATTQPEKVAYAIGEEFDSTGMTVSHKCENCEGEVIDNLFLTYEYQTADATAFALGDTKITVKFNDLALDVAVTVSKLQAQITGVEASYTTACGVAPTISAVSNIPELPIDVKYFAGETEVTAEDFVAGNSYTVKLSVEDTDTVDGTETTAEIVVEHKYAWKEDAADWKKLNYVCNCGDAKDFYALNYQSPYVDADNLGIDLSKFVVGANAEVVSVQQIVRMKDGTYVGANDGDVVAIEYVVDGSIYSFAANKYEQPSGEWKPYILTLSVAYTIGGVECNVIVEAKLVDKLIKTAEDLLSVQYKDGNTVAGGGTMDSKYYVLANDIDVSGVDFGASKVAFQQDIGFRGTFEGCGYTISNMNITGGFGLFGAIGYGAKINNVTFTNVKLSAEYALAYAVRAAHFTNVDIQFSLDSARYAIAYSMNDCTFNSVSILTDKNVAAPFLVNENPDTVIPDTVTLNYFTQYTVTFNTDGGNAIEPAKVTTGRTVDAPAEPTKTSDEWDYVFLGWYNGETQWNFNTSITEDVTLTAKWEQLEKVNAETVINLIAALPDTLVMPKDINYLNAIQYANEKYNGLSDENKAAVTNASKLENVLSACKGYATVYTPNVAGVKAVPAVLHNSSPDVAVTGAVSTDETQGAIFTATAEAGGKAAIQFVKFPAVSAYEKVYFYVRTDVADCKLYIAEDTGSDGWGSNWVNNSGTINSYSINNANEWTLICVEVSSNLISSDWIMSIYTTEKVNTTLEVGAIIGYKTPAMEKIETSLQLGVTADTGTTNDYGKVYNLTQEQYYIDNNLKNSMGTLSANELADTLPAGYSSFTFWIYNPTDTVYNFHLAGSCGEDWVDSADSYALAAKAWTQVNISAADIELNKGGQWYVYILGGAGDGATKTGWQVSTVYAVKAV